MEPRTTLIPERPVSVVADDFELKGDREDVGFVHFGFCREDGDLVAAEAAEALYDCVYGVLGRCGKS